MKSIYGASIPPGVKSSTRGQIKVRVDRVVLDSEPLSLLVGEASRKIVESPYLSFHWWGGEEHPSPVVQPSSLVQRTSAFTVVFPVKTNRNHVEAYFKHSSLANSGLEIRVLMHEVRGAVNLAEAEPISVGRSIIRLEEMSPNSPLAGWFSIVSLPGDSQGYSAISHAQVLGRMKICVTLEYFGDDASARDKKNFVHKRIPSGSETGEESDNPTTNASNRSRSSSSGGRGGGVVGTSRNENKNNSNTDNRSRSTSGNKRNTTSTIRTSSAKSTNSSRASTVSSRRRNDEIDNNDGEDDGDEVVNQHNKNELLVVGHQIIPLPENTIDNDDKEEERKERLAKYQKKQKQQQLSALASSSSPTTNSPNNNNNNVDAETADDLFAAGIRLRHQLAAAANRQTIDDVMHAPRTQTNASNYANNDNINNPYVPLSLGIPPHMDGVDGEKNSKHYSNFYNTAENDNSDSDIEAAENEIISHAVLKSTLPFVDKTNTTNTNIHNKKNIYSGKNKQKNISSSRHQNVVVHQAPPSSTTQQQQQQHLPQMFTSSASPSIPIHQQHQHQQQQHSQSNQQHQQQQQHSQNQKENNNNNDNSNNSNIEFAPAPLSPEQNTSPLVGSFVVRVCVGQLAMQQPCSAVKLVARFSPDVLFTSPPELGCYVSPDVDLPIADDDVVGFNVAGIRRLTTVSRVVIELYAKPMFSSVVGNSLENAASNNKNASVATSQDELDFQLVGITMAPICGSASSGVLRGVVLRNPLSGGSVQAQCDVYVSFFQEVAVSGTNNIPVEHVERQQQHDDDDENNNNDNEEDVVDHNVDPGLQPFSHHQQQQQQQTEDSNTPPTPPVPNVTTTVIPRKTPVSSRNSQASNNSNVSSNVSVRRDSNTSSSVAISSQQQQQQQLQNYHNSNNSNAVITPAVGDGITAATVITTTEPPTCFKLSLKILEAKNLTTIKDVGGLISAPSCFAMIDDVLLFPPFQRHHNNTDNEISANWEIMNGLPDSTRLALNDIKPQFDFSSEIVVVGNDVESELGNSNKQQQQQQEDGENDNNININRKQTKTDLRKKLSRITISLHHCRNVETAEYFAQKSIQQGQIFTSSIDDESTTTSNINNALAVTASTTKKNFGMLLDPERDSRVVELLQNSVQLGIVTIPAKTLELMSFDGWVHAIDEVTGDSVGQLRVSCSLVPG